MSDMPEVWVAEQGCYSERSITGVYATAEAAMAAHPHRQNMTLTGGGARYPRWIQEGPGCWRNNGDWGDAVTITRYEVEVIDGASLDQKPKS